MNLYKALADLSSNQPTNHVVVIEPAVLEENEKVNKSVSKEVIENYETLVTSANNLEDFTKALNAICGALNLNLSDDLVKLAKIANKLRERKGLSPL